eukprot:TRINITY_DN1277_c0_g1_i3.p1 TRINITY_DN1277_c0_g1~~TRINITY_DN1277_c0_g1_i3.p1  ORF type:complete len:961 (-),score=159.69 TRINITY_DN1277_c0_g1_i3:203-3085(-)
MMPSNRRPSAMLALLLLFFVNQTASFSLRAKGVEEVSRYTHDLAVDKHSSAARLSEHNASAKHALPNSKEELTEAPPSTTAQPATTTTAARSRFMPEQVSHAVDSVEQSIERDDRLMLLVGMLITVMPVCIAIALTLLQLCPLHSAYKPGKPEPEWGFIEKLFLSHKCQRFGENFQLALRGAAFGVVAVLPYVVPSWRWLYEEGRYSSYAVLMFVFTLYRNAGDTINFAFGGIMGTFWAVLNVFLMHGFMPGGFTSDPDYFTPGVIDTVAFILVMLVVNVSSLTRVFALSWHVYFMMEFLRPGATGWSQGFVIDRKGPAVAALMQSGIGCGLAVVATLLPYPIFALDQARVTAVKLTNELATGYDKCVECYCADSRKPIIEDGLRHSLSLMRATIQDLNSYVASAWWECLGRGRPQRIRLVLNKLDHTIREIHNRLSCTMYAIGEEEYSERHAKMMKSMKPSLKSLVTEASALFVCIVDACNDGDVSEADAQRMKDQKAKTTVAIEAVSMGFVSLNPSQKIEFELTDENSFFISCCSYGRMACDMADEVMDLQRKDFPKENVSPFSFLTIPTDDLVYRNAVVRNFVSILFAFAVGYVGRGQILQPYNSGPAGVVTLLISSSFGSAITTNMGRLQGVVLGGVFGQLAYALFAYCGLYGQVMVSSYVFLWLLATLFGYYHARDPVFSTVACLLAAFGVTGVLLGCSDEVYTPTGLSKIIGTVIGVTIMSISDQVFSVKTSSRYAFEALDAAWDIYKASMNAVFDPKCQEIRKHAGDMLGHISLAESTTLLASTEPRFSRTPFKEELFRAICESMHELRQSLTNLEVNCTVSGNDDAPKAAFLRHIVALPEFEIVRKDWVSYTEAVDQVMQIFMHDTEECFFTKYGIKAAEGKCPLDIAKDNLDRLVEAIGGFLKEVSFGEEGGSKDFHNLEHNHVCKVSAFIFYLNWQFRVLYKMKHRMLSV